jgi:hypothetical protein
VNAAVCLIVKNEVADLTEWVVHHANLGFDRLIIYDNCSDDGTTDLICKLQSVLPIDLYKCPTDADGRTQFRAYEDCLERTRGIYDWVAFIDCDEFIVPYGTHTLTDLLDSHRRDSAFALNWLIFGSSGLESLRGSLVMEALTRRAPFDFEVNRHVKCFVRPIDTRTVINSHAFGTTRPCVNLLGREISWSIPGLVDRSQIVHGVWGGLHHYFLRTRQHWERKVRRGKFDFSTREISLFAAYDRNEVMDESAFKYGGLAARRIACLGLAEVRACLPAERPTISHPVVRGLQETG